MATQATITTLTVTGNASIGGNLTVTGNTTTNDLIITNHLISQGPTPTITALPAAGTNATATITGTDLSGTITITTGANSTAGDLVNVTFNKKYGAGNLEILITPNSKNSAQLLVYPDQETISGFKSAVVNSPQANSTYIFNYLVIDNKSA